MLGCSKRIIVDSKTISIAWLLFGHNTSQFPVHAANGGVFNLIEDRAADRITYRCWRLFFRLRRPSLLYRKEGEGGRET